MSIAPCRPRLLFLITSGDMYIGVPVRLLFVEPGTSGVGVPVPSLERLERAIVRWFLARILAAPKSTYLITPM